MAKRQGSKTFVWTEPRVLQLILFYKKHPSLWDFADPNYNNKDIERESLTELAKQFGNSVTTNAIRTKFHHLQLGYLKSQQVSSRRNSEDRALSQQQKDALSFLQGLEPKNKHENQRRGGRKTSQQTASDANSKELTSRSLRNGNKLVVNIASGSGDETYETGQGGGKPGTASERSPSKSSFQQNTASSQGSEFPKTPIGPDMGSPRFTGLSTFARLPRRDEVDHCDVAVVGIPFDAGTTYRPGARFGPAAIRAGSRLLRPYHPGLQIPPFATIQVADCGDIVANPFKIDVAIAQITSAATSLVSTGAIPVILGGDHTVALPMLRAVNSVHGPVALLHFDAHLDTWDTYFGAPYTHGSVFLRAAEEGLLDPDRLTHLGIRGPLYSSNDLIADAELGFKIISTMDVAEIGVKETAKRIKQRIGDAALYISIDIDVLDPAHAPGTGTPEAGGLTSRELLGILRALAGCNIVGADVVEVSPAYDHAEVTAIAAAHVVYELISLVATTRRSKV